MKRIVLIIIIIFSICPREAGAAVAARSFLYNPSDLAKATGTVVGIGRNSIQIYDEDQKRVERFVYLRQDDQCRKGDYIRIFYHPLGGVVVIIKKMTVLEYKENGQNLGNIFRDNRRN